MNIKYFFNISIYRKTTRQWGLLFLFILIYLWKAFKYIDVPIAPDAALVYLPFAKAVLEQGFNFFLKTESIIVSPVSYLWPALFGGAVNVIQYVNILTGVVLVLLFYGIGTKLHSHQAGLVAAFLFSMSPFLISWIPTALSEPPYFLFTLIWFWSLGEIFSDKKWAISVGAIALCLSILTRSIWFYPSILFLFSALFWIVFKSTGRRTAFYLVISLSLGLILPLLVIIKNFMLFDLLAINAGSGGALFYGTNLMTNGFEPPLLGLNYEHGFNPEIISRNKEHASIAMQFLRERDLPALLEWYVTKISWVTFFTSIEATTKHTVWRVIEISMAMTCIWWAFRKRNILILLMGAGLVLQILQTSFVLYNMRYSTDNLELLLIPLAAVGIVLSLNVGNGVFNKIDGVTFYRRYKHGVFSAITTLLLFVLAYFRSIPIVNLPSNIPVSTLFESSNVLKISDASALKNSEVDFKNLVEIYVPQQILPVNIGNALWEIKMTVFPAAESQCVKASVYFNSKYNSNDGKGRVNIKIYDDGVPHTYLLGTANRNSNLWPVKEGVLSIKFHCSSKVKVVVDKITLIAPHFIEAYFRK